MVFGIFNTNTNKIDVNKKEEKKAVIDEVVDFDEALAKLGNTNSKQTEKYYSNDL